MGKLDSVRRTLPETVFKSSTPDSCEPVISPLTAPSLNGPDNFARVDISADGL